MKSNKNMFSKILGLFLTVLTFIGSFAYAGDCSIKLEELDDMVKMTTQGCEIDYSAPAEYGVNFTMIGYVWWDDFGNFGVHDKVYQYDFDGDIKEATDISGVIWMIETDKNNVVVSIGAYDKKNDIIVMYAEFDKKGKATQVLMHLSIISG